MNMGKWFRVYSYQNDKRHYLLMLHLIGMDGYTLYYDYVKGEFYLYNSDINSKYWVVKCADYIEDLLKNNDTVIYRGNYDGCIWQHIIQDFNYKSIIKDIKEGHITLLGVDLSENRTTQWTRGERFGKR